MYMKKVFYLPLYRSCDGKFFHDWLFYVNLGNFVPWCQHFVQLISTLIKSYYCCVYILRNYQHYYYIVASTQCPSKIAAAEPDPWCNYCSFVFYYLYSLLSIIFICFYTRIDSGGKWKGMLLLLLKFKFVPFLLVLE